ncbi:ABC transporter ATP-binding protein [Acuticoccus mangrovi]|uniref:ABC transporter ATP-binding protein n=1 Tax=Acuticoccus mangrovi TaxID=2796142 RepID=A0A934ITL5_9HYPH|nr:ABC transporter ATP-binding protein [Acuticoccus mangrovi]MBJ3778505.1 ABC transporter ATP-binding protein [Acuticoccus mangrovi]
MSGESIAAATGDILEVAGLSRNFGAIAAVADLSFKVREGEVKAVIGPNGAGKTTLFDMIAGVTAPSSGRITLAGERIERMPAHKRVDRGIGRTFQTLQIFTEMSVLENVVVGHYPRGHSGWVNALLRLPSGLSEERREREHAMALLERVGLADRANDRAGDLSFGDRKLLELMRALATGPRLLLLDEPAAGLSHAGAERMMEIVAELNADGLSVLLVEHNMRMVMNLSHDILVIGNGRFIAEGTPDAVRTNPDVIAAYLGEDEDA